MEPAINWFQAEQDGPAKDIWMRFWQTNLELEGNMNLKEPVAPTSTTTTTTGTGAPTIQDNSESTDSTTSGPTINSTLLNGTAVHTNGTNGGTLGVGVGGAATMGKHERSNGVYLTRKRNVENRASLRGVNQHPDIIRDYGGCPWLKDGFEYLCDIRGLHAEIEHFYEYMSPTLTEHRIRGEVIKRIKNIILSMWPETQVQVFGSYRTGLYLPTSDIDMVVIGKWSHLPLRTLEKEFLDKDIADVSSIKVLDKASVPIVKLTDKRTDIKVDISFNMSNGVRSAELIENFLRTYPALPKLVYVLKQFLLERDLNEVFTGGISSYSLILMCISFLQLHHRNSEVTRSDVNLGILLMEFLELYGRKFNYMYTAIRIRDGGRYVKKEDMQKDMIDGHRPSMLCIEDPLQPSNDIGRSSYGVLHVKRAFDYAYIILAQVINRGRVNVNTYTRGCKRNSSILGRILLVTDEVVRYRQWVEEKFGGMIQLNNSMLSTVSSGDGGANNLLLSLGGHSVGGSAQGTIGARLLAGSSVALANTTVSPVGYHNHIPCSVEDCCVEMVHMMQSIVSGAGASGDLTSANGTGGMMENTSTGQTHSRIPRSHSSDSTGSADSRGSSESIDSPIRDPSPPMSAFPSLESTTGGGSGAVANVWNNHHHVSKHQNATAHSSSMHSTTNGPSSGTANNCNSVHHATHTVYGSGHQPPPYHNTAYYHRQTQTTHQQSQVTSNSGAQQQNNGAAGARKNVQPQHQHNYGVRRNNNAKHAGNYNYHNSVGSVGSGNGANERSNSANAAVSNNATVSSPSTMSSPSSNSSPAMLKSTSSRNKPSNNAVVQSGGTAPSPGGGASGAADILLKLSKRTTTNANAARIVCSDT